MTSAPDAASRVLAVAQIATRGAVLLRGGVHPGRALQLAAQEATEAEAPTVEQAFGMGSGARARVGAGHGSRSRAGAGFRARAGVGSRAPEAVFALLSERLAQGVPATEALCTTGEGPEWRLLAAAWFLAEHSGAPLAPALDRIAEALQGLAQLRERRATLLAGPRMTVRLVASLPPLALLLGGLLGFDPAAVLLSPVGVVLLVIGTGLLGVGVAWARRVSRAVASRDRVAGIELELAWIVMRGGTSPGEAVLRVTDCVSDLDVEWVRFDDLREGRTLRNTLATAERVGVPVGPLLLEAAGAVRARAHAELERDAERLGVRVLVPLGVCVLPAFIFLGVLPVLFSMLGGIG